MTISALHTIGPVVLDDTVDVIIGGVGNLRAGLGTEVRSDALSGEVYSRFASIFKQEPLAEFTTRNIKTLLANIPVTGKSIASIASGLAMYATQIADGGSRMTGANHSKFTMTRGLIALAKLTCQHQGDVEASISVRAAYDGTNNPLIKTDTVSLPTLPTEERFTIGPLTLESTVFNQIKSFELDFGLQLMMEGADSVVWPEFPYIKAIQPVWTFRGCKLAHFGTAPQIPITGKLLTHANTKFFLKKRKDGETYELDASAVHLKLTTAGIAVITDVIRGDSGNPAEIDIQITSKYDGTNAPVVVTADQAIA